MFFSNVVVTVLAAQALSRDGRASLPSVGTLGVSLLT